MNTNAFTNQLFASENEYVSKDVAVNNRWVGLPTNTGIRFVNKAEIVLFQYTKKSDTQKEKWEVLLCTSETFQLKMNTTAKDIFKYFDESDFIQICQRCIVGLRYLQSIETKTHKCILHAPFHKLDMLISRNCLSQLKERFDI